MGYTFCADFEKSPFFFPFLIIYALSSIKKNCGEVFSKALKKCAAADGFTSCSTRKLV